MYLGSKALVAVAIGDIVFSACLFQKVRVTYVLEQRLKILPGGLLVRFKRYVSRTF